MRITFRRRGGIAPAMQGREVIVDTGTLAADEAAKVEPLAQQALQTSGTAEPLAHRTVPDAFTYEVSVDTGGQARTFVASDTDMPDTLRPLVQWLLQWTNPAKPDAPSR